MFIQKLLSVGFFAASITLNANAQQIVPSSQPDTPLGGFPNNTGIAIAPAIDLQAAVNDDGGGNFFVNWIEGASGNVVDNDQGNGNDPDVAYYLNADLLAVVYEQGGNIMINRYSLVTLSPTADYTLSGTISVGSGTYPNIDIASNGNGIVTWEDGGQVFVRTYDVTSNSLGPVVNAGQGNQPDAVAMDNADFAGVTYVDQGKLIIDFIFYPPLNSAAYSIANQWVQYPNDGYRFPRIASDRHEFYGTNALNFTVVAQDYNPTGSAQVDGFFILNGTTLNGPVDVNSNFTSCYGDDPLPVVTYHLGRVLVMWNQNNSAGCATLVPPSATSTEEVLVRYFNSAGSPATNYLQVNQIQSAFVSVSRNAISTEYDGAYMVTGSNYHSGVLYNDTGDLFWKGISSSNPNYIDEQGITATRENNFSLATSPVDQTIEVISEDDAPATFTLLDNAGRTVELKTIANNGNNYSIDVSHLSGGLYFLHCSSKGNEEILRVLQIRK